MSVSVQKISSVLRKAGFTSTKFQSSGQIRGWGSATAGYKIRKGYDPKHAGLVEHCFGSHARAAECRTDDELMKYKAALEAAGLVTEYEVAHRRLLVKP